MKLDLLPEPGRAYRDTRWCAKCQRYTPTTTQKIGTVQHNGQTVGVWEMTPCKHEAQSHERGT